VLCSQSMRSTLHKNLHQTNQRSTIVQEKRTQFSSLGENKNAKRITSFPYRSKRKCNCTSSDHSTISQNRERQIMQEIESQRRNLKRHASSSLRLQQGTITRLHNNELPHSSSLTTQPNLANIQNQLLHMSTTAKRDQEANPRHDTYLIEPPHLAYKNQTM
jgi:hypothetical protein